MRADVRVGTAGHAAAKGVFSPAVQLRPVPGRRGGEAAARCPASRDERAAVGMGGGVQHGAGPVTGGGRAQPGGKRKTLRVFKGFWRVAEGALARLVAELSPWQPH